MSVENIAGWSSSVARRAHNPKVVGSNPAPATNMKPLSLIAERFIFFNEGIHVYGCFFDINGNNTLYIFHHILYNKIV